MEWYCSLSLLEEIKTDKELSFLVESNIKSCYFRHSIEFIKIQYHQVFMSVFEIWELYQICFSSLNCLMFKMCLSHQKRIDWIIYMQYVVFIHRPLSLEECQTLITLHSKSIQTHFVCLRRPKNSQHIFFVKYHRPYL